MNMNTLHGDVFEYWPEEIATALLINQNYSFNGPAADFDKQAIIDCLYWIKDAAENEYNFDYWRQFYNLLAAINGAAIIPF